MAFKAFMASSTVCMCMESAFRCSPDFVLFFLLQAVRQSVSKTSMSGVAWGETIVYLH